VAYSTRRNVMTRLQANGLLLLAAFFWGAGNVAQKTVLDDLAPLTTVGCRCLIGALVILPLLRRELVGRRRLAGRDIRGIVLVAILFAGAIVAQQTAYGGTSVTNASFLVSTTTVLTPLAAWLLRRDRPAPVVWVAIAAALSGAFLMGGMSPAALAWGDIVCVASAALYSVWFVILGEVVIRTGQPVMVTTAQFALTGAACLAAGLFLEPIDLDRLIAALPELLVLGVFSTGVAYALQAVAQQFTSANEAAVLTSAESVFGALGGALLLAERPTLAAAVGAALIVLAILAIQLGATLLAPSLRVQRAG
jgi:drug/metabolite transporter (DMT)-like permease